MSTLWTPGGERPVGNAERAQTDGAHIPQTPETADAGHGDQQVDMDALREQLASTPPEIVIRKSLCWAV